MTEEKKPKRKYTRRPKVEPLSVYSVLVRVKSGRKVETIHGESTRVENGCLVVVSMDGPQPLVEKTRYIPLGGAEIEVCQRPQYRPMREVQTTQQIYEGTLTGVAAPSFSHVTSGPRIEAGPLELARQRGAVQPVAPTRPTVMVERNHEGLPVVAGGFTDSGGNF